MTGAAKSRPRSVVSDSKPSFPSATGWPPTSAPVGRSPAPGTAPAAWRALRVRPRQWGQRWRRRCRDSQHPPRWRADGNRWRMPPRARLGMWADHPGRQDRPGACSAATMHASRRRAACSQHAAGSSARHRRRGIASHSRLGPGSWPGPAVRRRSAAAPPRSGRREPRNSAALRPSRRKALPSGAPPWHPGLRAERPSHGAAVAAPSAESPELASPE
mmetsp:Transcript_45386/g.145621  ORF Transcript_45386/g.145621 Transcript_45386/m.145621 type:complete len:217 (-) Transcript_45386:158-808(-)